MSKSLRVVQWIEQPNLGDRFTSLWLTKQGIEHTVTDTYAEGNFIGVGSLLEQCQGHSLTIWGTGRVTDPRTVEPVNLTKATVLALRGPLSALGSYGARSAVNLRKGFVMGDPGLLAADLLDGEGSGALIPNGAIFVPHWTDYARVSEMHGKSRVVNLLGDPLDALLTIQGADIVVSSSLHGIIFADAFGVERVWDYQESVPGQGFKFRDYASLVGKFEPGDSVKVADSIIRQIQDDLRGVFSQWSMNHVN